MIQNVRNWLKIWTNVFLYISKMTRFLSFSLFNVFYLTIFASIGQHIFKNFTLKILWNIYQAILCIIGKGFSDLDWNFFDSVYHENTLKLTWRSTLIPIKVSFSFLQSTGLPSSASLARIDNSEIIDNDVFMITKMFIYAN